jgi:hypothetical protein
MSKSHSYLDPNSALHTLPFISSFSSNFPFQHAVNSEPVARSSPRDEGCLTWIFSLQIAVTDLGHRKIDRVRCSEEGLTEFVCHGKTEVTVQPILDASK